MTDRETLHRRLDELVADIKSLDDVEALREVVQYIDRVVVSVWPEPMPDDDFDLRAVDGSLWRLRRRDAESDAAYAERRRIRDEQAATLQTYPLSWSDFEMISPPTPEPMSDDVADAIEAEVAPPDDPTERRLRRRQERDTGLLGPGLRLVHLVLGDDDRDQAAAFAQSLVTLAEARDDAKIAEAVDELKTTLRKIGGDD